MVTFNKNFKYDLEFGEIREKKVSDILLNKKIEVKTERGLWQETGNIAIEVAYRGKKSGLASTEADYWLHILESNGQEFCSFLFPVEVLKKRIKELHLNSAHHSLSSFRQNHNGLRIVMGGDDNQSKLVLIPISELFKIGIS